MRLADLFDGPLDVPPGVELVAHLAQGCGIVTGGEQACDASGVAPTTFKYYIREGLVPEGERVGSNQTEYNESHVRRVRLVRALIETGGLSIAASRDVLSVMDANLGSPAYFLEAAQHALDRDAAHSRTPASEDARQKIIDLFGPDAKISSHNIGIELAARALDGFSTIAFEPSPEYLSTYLASANANARVDLAALMTKTTPESIAELMVVGTVMGDVLSAGLRRLWHEAETSTVFPTAETEKNESEQ